MHHANTRPLEIDPRATAKGVDEAYDAEAGRWDRKHVNRRAMAENRYVFDMVRNSGHLDGDVLEIGCGTGLLLEWCPIPASRYIGIDISSGMVQVAQIKFADHKFMVADMSALPFDYQTFDNVVSVFAAFSYAKDPAKALREFQRVLKPGGQLMIMPYGMKELELGEYVVHDKEGRAIERLGYTAEELERLMLEEFFDVRVVGFSGPLTRDVSGHLSQVAADTLVAAESEALRWWPGQHSSFMIGTGRRRSW